MEHPGFFDRAGPFSLREVAERVRAVIPAGADPDLAIADVRPLDGAGRSDLTFLDNPRYLMLFAATEAAACLVSKRFIEKAPDGLVCLVTEEPYRAFSRALALFYPGALKPKAAPGAGGQQGTVHPSARLEAGVVVEPSSAPRPQSEAARRSPLAV